MNTSQVYENAGSINERGTLDGWGRLGMTPARSLLELWAGSLDSYDDMDELGFDAPKKVLALYDEDTVRLYDGAMGMTAERVHHMFALHRENYQGKQRRGVSGKGSKVGMSILNRQQDMAIRTHRPDGPFLYVTVPWKEIYESGVYTGKIQIRPMTPDEVAEFLAERTQAGLGPHGTTFDFKTNPDLLEVLKANWTPIPNGSSLTNPNDRIDVVFGREDVEFYLEQVGSSTPPQPMKLYNYFGAADYEYYQGVQHEVIEQWYSALEKRDVFLWRKNDGTFWEVKGSDKKADKEAVASDRPRTRDYQCVGEYDVAIGLRKDLTIYDPANGVLITSAKRLGTYNAEFLGNENWTYLAATKLVRNNQEIGLIPQSDGAAESARGNAESNLEGRLIQCQTSYRPTSEQTNQQDRAMGIQENKNQLHGEAVSKRMTRLIKAMKHKKAKELATFFGLVKQPAEKKKKATVTPPASVASAEEELPAQEEQVHQVLDTSSEEGDTEVHHPFEAQPPQPPQPIDVPNQRKGMVKGEEFAFELERVLELIRADPGRVYQDTNTIFLFNKLRRFTA